MSQTKLNQMVNNEQYIFDNMASVSYRAHGIVRDKSMKIMAGQVFIPPNKQSFVSVPVYFNNFFSDGCMPVVTTGMESTTITRAHVSLRGIGKIHPDSRGFNVHISMDSLPNAKKNIYHGFWIDWIAIGY